MKNGKLIVIAAPSGSGKTTIVKNLISDKSLNLGFSISATSREKRKNEINGKDYYFLSKGEFEEKINLNEFVEWEEVYDNTFYGTLKSEINDVNSLGKNLIFDIDAIGGLSIKKEFPENTLTIFICPPSLEELENRLRKRGTDSEEKIKIRLSKASKEMSMAMLYDYAIENHNLEETVAKIKILINNFL
jgi:guanylate kinase